MYRQKEVEEKMRTDNTEILYNALEKIKELEIKLECFKDWQRGLFNISTNMKARCMGEFYEEIELTDEDGEEYTHRIILSWTNIKEAYGMMLKEKLKEDNK